MARFVLVLLFLSAFVAEGAWYYPRSAAERYWHKVLPSTPIPLALRSSLLEESKQFWNWGSWVGWWGRVIPGTGVGVVIPGTGVGVVVPGVGVGVGGGVVIPGTGVGVVVPGVGIVVNATPGSPFQYNYAATETQVRAAASSTIFFLEKDLTAGSKMTVTFPGITSKSSFLPNSIAKSTPFSSSQLPKILSLFSIKPNSPKAQIISKTLKRCEEKPVNGETSLCVTSLESMADFAIDRLGSSKLLASSTTVRNPKPSQQVYTVEKRGVRRLGNSAAVACHPEDYPYAVFFCHSAIATKSYSVSLVGEEGSKVKAVVVCHEDTSKWNPKHIAFQLLKVKPGTVPVCHFLPPDHVLFTKRG